MNRRAAVTLLWSGTLGIALVIERIFRSVTADPGRPNRQFGRAARSRRLRRGRPVWVGRSMVLNRKSGVIHWPFPRASRGQTEPSAAASRFVPSDWVNQIQKTSQTLEGGKQRNIVTRFEQ